MFSCREGFICKDGKKKSNRLHQGLHPSEPFPAQIGHTERPRIVKGTMELNPNEFLCASF